MPMQLTSVVSCWLCCQGGMLNSWMQARLPHLYSCLQYLANFHSSGDWNGAAGFQVWKMV